jgi:hypothetical protein
MTHDDDKFDAFLEREAQGFNAPPAEVPREAMWETITAARAARRAAAAPLPQGADVLALAQRRRLRYAPWIGMAATLLLGVGIGRYAWQQRGPDGAAPDSVAVAPATGSAQAAPVAPATVPATVPAATEARTPRGEAVRYASAMRASREVQNATLAAAPIVPSRRSAASGTYSIASQQHLTRAEALVAVVATMPQDAMMDSLTARWAKDVLTNTRLLLDSPAGDDPVRRRLLEDLETVLVQLVQRSDRTAEDRAMIDRTLQKTQLLTRLRSGATGT